MEEPSVFISDGVTTSEFALPLTEADIERAFDLTNILLKDEKNKIVNFQNVTNGKTYQVSGKKSEKALVTVNRPTTSKKGLEQLLDYFQFGEKKKGTVDLSEITVTNNSARLLVQMIAKKWNVLKGAKEDGPGSWAEIHDSIRSIIDCENSNLQWTLSSNYPFYLATNGVSIAWSPSLSYLRVDHILGEPIDGKSVCGLGKKKDTTLLPFLCCERKTLKLSPELTYLKTKVVCTNALYWRILLKRKLVVYGLALTGNHAKLSRYSFHNNILERVLYDDNFFDPAKPDEFRQLLMLLKLLKWIEQVSPQ